jgi:hypothetical protein
MKKSRTQFTLLVTIIFFSFASFGQAARYDVTLKEIDELAKLPNVDKFLLGKNDQNENIYGLIIKGQEPIVNHHLVVGTHHGNELRAAEVPILFAKDIISVLQNPNHPHFAKLNKSHFHIVPVLNINGYNRAIREELDSSRRSHDPNRDYPDPCATKVDYRLKSTKLISEYIINNNIVAAVSIHGYIGTFTFPWGIFTDTYETEHHQELLHWGEEAAKVNGYKVGSHGGLIYPTAGAFEDWAYYQLGVWSFLLELDRNADMKKDAKTLTEFFALAPSNRAISHAHEGKCTTIFSERSMPAGRP